MRRWRIAQDISNDPTDPGQEDSPSEEEEGSSPDPTHPTPKKKPSPHPGFHIFYQDAEFQVVEIGGKDGNAAMAGQAACYFAPGTKWCPHPGQLSQRSFSKRSLFVIYYHGQKAALYQPPDPIQDPNGTPIKLNPMVKAFLIKTRLINRVIESGGLGQLLEDTPGQPWPELEPFVIKDAEAASDYAVYCLRKRWPVAEKAILQEPWAALKYAGAVLRSVWPEAEDIIKSDPDAAVRYARYLKVVGRGPNKTS